VDIISLSWTTNKKDTKLNKAISDAASPENPNQRPTLVFCSVADEGVYSRNVYPLRSHPDKTLSVAATDKFGHMTAASLRAGNDDDVIQVPGEAIAASGPSYMNQDPETDAGVGVNIDAGKKPEDETVSGSSAATALAAGIASFALLMIRAYMDPKPAEWHQYHKRENMLKVFQQMDSHLGGIVLGNLFPKEADHRKLKSNWNQENLLKKVNKE